MPHLTIFGSPKYAPIHSKYGQISQICMFLFSAHCCPWLRLVTTDGGVLFSTEITQFWPVLTNFGHFVANLRKFGVLFIGLNIMVVYQN